jgi:hypothetical protein
LASPRLILASAEEPLFAVVEAMLLLRGADKALSELVAAGSEAIINVRYNGSSRGFRRGLLRS